MERKTEIIEKIMVNAKMDGIKTSLEILDIKGAHKCRDLKMVMVCDYDYQLRLPKRCFIEKRDFGVMIVCEDEYIEGRKFNVIRVLRREVYEALDR